MTKNNNKSVLVALLLAPLLTAGFTVGNIPQAEAIPEIPFEISFECVAISTDTIQWNFDITNLGDETFSFGFQLVLETSAGIFFDDGGVVVVDAGDTASASLETSEGPSVYTGTLTVTNEIGKENTDTDSCVTLPPTPEEKIDGLIGEVEALDLNNGNKNALTKKLSNAIKNITNEDPTDDSEACEKLQSFIDQLNAFVNAGKLELSEVEDMQNKAHQLIWDLCLDT